MTNTAMIARMIREMDEEEEEDASGRMPFSFFLVSCLGRTLFFSSPSFATILLITEILNFKDLY